MEPIPINALVSVMLLCRGFSLCPAHASTVIRDGEGWDGVIGAEGRGRDF